MKVFGIGLSKTGTKTLGICLQRLGYDHFSWNPDFTLQVLRGDLSEAARVAHRHDSFDDLPWPSLYKLMDEHFPDAKFVLTVRENPDVWYRSLVRHAEYKGATEERKLFYGHEIPHGYRREDVALYEQHSRDVQTYFKDRPDKLLVICWKRERDWTQLCDFLGVAAPDEPLPHANKRRKRSLKQYVRRFRYRVESCVRQRAESER
ncbi:hypothetical protein BH24DEI2_BH24DEI2_14060 [soil metagenome]